MCVISNAAPSCRLPLVGLILGVILRESEVSGLLFADDFVEMSDTLEGLQKQIDAVIEFGRKWRFLADVKK